MCVVAVDELMHRISIRSQIKHSKQITEKNHKKWTKKKSYNVVVDVKYAAAEVRMMAVPKDCAIANHLYWVQLWAPREADKLSSQALIHLFSPECGGFSSETKTKKKKIRKK